METKNQSKSISQVSQNQSLPANQQSQPESGRKDNRPFNIGIIVSEENLEDIQYYNSEFVKINKLFNDQVNLIFCWYKKDEDKENVLDGVNYLYSKPVTIIHHYKQLKELNIDLLFIPLIKNVYNATSETLKNFQEAAVVKIPVMVLDIHPYNKEITNNLHGFLYPSKEMFIPYLKSMFEATKFPVIKLCGNHAYDLVMKNHHYSPENIRFLSNVFHVPVPKQPEAQQQ